MALRKIKHSAGVASMPLFEGAEPEIPSEYSNDRKKARMLMERELLSLDLSTHPLDFCQLGDGFTKISDLRSLATGKPVKITGSVIRYQTPPIRNGNRVVYIILEDGTSVVDATVFSITQAKCGSVLFREGWIIIEGRIQRRGPKSISIIADNLFPLKCAG